MGTGALTSYFDVAQVVLYAFWIFFFGLVYYLHRETKREGYPIEMDTPNGKVQSQGWPDAPSPKTFNLPHGQGSRTVPGPRPDEYEVAAQPMWRSPGAPLQPTGDPMLDGVGPAAWAIRPETPDLTEDGEPRIVPLRAAPGWGLTKRDPDPRGMPVVGCDGKVGGTVTEAWVDLAEPFLRYLEVDADGRIVLLPMTMARIKRNKTVVVNSIRGDQFAGVPTLANPDQVTLQEEDKITAYYGGGTLYATPQRSEPLL